ncbi:MAG: patatin-like phospholipase family protein [Bacteroidia bacterium]|nr:patatin-like phospholipase family protein [Bacteroidia bacterium]
MSQNAPVYTILSLDGGGIRGIIPCKVLEYIEARLYDETRQDGPGIAELFDLIAGTSTGGLLACGLNIKNENGRPKYRAAELMDLYRGEIAGKIFSTSWLGSVSNIFRSKFPAENIEEVLKSYFGKSRLSDTISDLLITSYNTDAKRPFYFKSSDYRKNPEVENFLLWEIARATSAAPTFFPPKKIEYGGILPILNKDFNLVQRKINHLSLVDGGVFANNPSLLAYIEARETLRERGWKLASHSDAERPVTERSRGMFAEVEGVNEELPILMLSIGTGQTGQPYMYDDVKDWGLVEWVKPLIDILMQGVSETVDYQMNHLLPPYADKKKTPRYIRLDITLDPGHDEMDNPEDENTSRLADYGERIINHEENRKKLDQVCELLKMKYQKS